jgi:hypothetical protein
VGFQHGAGRADRHLAGLGGARLAVIAATA